MAITFDSHGFPSFPFLVTHSAEAEERRQVARFAELRDAETFVRRTDLFGQAQLDQAAIAAEARRLADEVIDDFLQLPLAELERQAITAAMTRHGGLREPAAKALGISLRGLYSKLKSYGWEPRQKAA